MLKRKCKDHAEYLSAIPGDKRAIAESKKASMAVNQIPPIQHVYMILQNKETSSFDDTSELVANQIDPMEYKLALRGVRKISRGGVLIIADNTADLQRIEA